MATEAAIRLLEAAKMYGLPRSYQHSPRNPAPPPHWDKLVAIDGFHVYIEEDKASKRGHKIRQKVDQYLRYYRRTASGFSGLRLVRRADAGRSGLHSAAGVPQGDHRTPLRKSGLEWVCAIRKARHSGGPVG